ncbi:MAG: outer membrane lipoprotein carrier protein LolA [Acidobacteria bacterium]|nr:outer membrane lipoprotein carrier protein LolA [Acidobacteriota bacterium]MBI3657182.1 outer membrane lipoprotein carrier protein LolA [Acidobacteriota bacterium]
MEFKNEAASFFFFRPRLRFSATIILMAFVAFSVCYDLAAARVTETNPEELDLKQVLALMNKFGRSFRSFTAKISQKKYIAVLKEFDQEEKGAFFYERGRYNQARLRKEIVSPTPSIAVIDEGIVTAYEPRVKQARRIDLGKDKDKAEFLAIGIGQSPAKLEETFHMKLSGTEWLQGRKTHVLELRPKSAKISALFSVITLWIDADRGMSIQQKLAEPNSDYTLVTFSDLKVNTKIPNGTFALKLPKDVQLIQ